MDATVVLVHGSGHTGAVWRLTQDAMTCPTLAVDLPGRASRPADITRVTVAEAAASVAADVDATVEGEVVLVGHSIAGTILPATAARLGSRVRHLVFVAGINAPHGEIPAAAFLDPDDPDLATRLAEWRAVHAGCSLEDLDIRTASSIDAINFTMQPMTWAGVPSTLERTFIRPTGDPIQPPAMQARFATACGASRVIDIESGHTPAIDAPVALAALLDDIARPR